MRTRARLVGCGSTALAGAVLLAGCSVGADVPTYDEALRAVNAAYDLRSADATTFCGDLAASASNCEAQFAAAGTAPSEPPTVQCHAVYEPSSTEYQPGRILRVAGEDEAGHSYQTEVMAISTSDGVALINAVYWGGAGISEEGTAGSDGTASALAPCEEVEAR